MEFMAYSVPHLVKYYCTESFIRIIPHSLSLAQMIINPEDFGGNEKIWRKLVNPCHPIMKFVFTFIFIFVDLTNSLTSDSVKVSYVGHSIGAIAGFVVGLAVLENKIEKRWESNIRIVIATFYTLFLFALIISHIVLTYVAIDGEYLFPNEAMNAKGGICTND